MRLVIEYTTTTTASTVSGSGDVYVEAGYSFNDSDNTFKASGTLISASSGSKSINVASNGRQKIHSFTFSHARGSATISKSMAFSLTGINYVGSGTTASVAATVSIPAAPTPDTPGSVVITRVSLTRVRITWTGGAAHVIQASNRGERGSSSAAWVTYQTVGSGARSSGVEYDFTTGYEWTVRVARVAEGVQSAWGYASTPARLFDAPPAPTSVTTTYQSDAKRTAGWVFADTDSARATAIEIAGWLQSRDTWSGAASLAASARSHIDTASAPNNRTRYRARAVNAAGGSAWAYGPYVSTTPAASTGVSAARSGSSDIIVTLTNRALSSQAKHDIQGQSSTDGVTWSAWTAVSGHTGIAAGAVGAVITRTLTGLDPAKRWRFRVITWVQEPTYLSATSGTSNVILLLQAPAAPRLIEPVTTQPAGNKVTFSVSHQSVDGSGQTAAEVRYRLDGGAWVTLTITGAATTATSTTTIPAGALEWQARARGAHADWSPWSGVASVLVAERPAVTITSPADGAPYVSNRLTLTATYSDPSGAAMTRYRRILRDALGAVLEDQTTTRNLADGSALTVAYSTVLVDGASYVAELLVTSGTGLQSVGAQITVPVAFLLPAVPTLVATWDPQSATVDLQVADGVAGVGVAETVANRIERSLGGGLTWETVADMVPVDGTTADPLPPFRPTLLYRAVAISALGAETESAPVEVDATCGDLWLTAEDGARCRIELDLALQVSYGHTRVAEEYLGQVLPEAHYGDGRPVQWRISGALLEGQGLDQDWRVLLGQDCYLREPGGDAMWVSIQPDGINHSSQWIKERSITLTADAVAHE